jgi:polar amino acid transport system substrate-binding protein
VASCLDYAPFEVVKGGNPEGFDIDVTDAIAAKLGVTVKWLKTDFDTSFTALRGNRFDMIAAAVTATGELGMERAQIVDFSDYYYNSRQSLTVNTTKTPDITSTDQLMAGDSVGVQKGSTGAAWAKDNLEPKGVELKLFTSSPDSFTDLQAGNLTGVINDGPASDKIVVERPGLKVVQYIDTNEKYAFAFSPSNSGLLAAWNAGLKALIAEGEYATIFMKWFPGAAVPPEFAAS